MSHRTLSSITRVRGQQGKMHIEFFVEDRSTEEAVKCVVPKVIGGQHTWRIHAYSGKRDLLRKLPFRLRGLAPWLPPDWRIVVLVDCDQQDCRQLKECLEQAAAQALLVTKKSARGGKGVQLLNRIAVEELEAWFFGDVEAIVSAYPRVPPNLASKKRYRKPDEIGGGTWEALERELAKAGYYRNGMPKVEVAQKIAQHMEPQRNRSASFKVFASGLRSLVG